MKPPKTIRGLMLFVAIIGIILGVAINAAPFFPLITAAAIVMAPQIFVVAICAYLSVRDERKRARLDSLESTAPGSLEVRTEASSCSRNESV
jgi:hypothetical protein